MAVAKYSPKALAFGVSKRVLQYPNDDICLGTLDALLAKAHERKLPENQRVKVTVQVRCYAKSHANHYCEDLGNVRPYRYPQETRTVAELKELYADVTGSAFEYAARKHKGQFIDFVINFGKTVTLSDML